jgi:hypothetical protein
VSPPSFGRRPGPQTQTPPAAAASAIPRKVTVFDEVAAEPPPPEPAVQSPSVDEELQQWKKSRKGFVIPWRQLSLMASLSFGVASLVLPASVNENVDYVLYALMGMSLYAGISKRLKI